MDGFPSAATPLSLHSSYPLCLLSLRFPAHDIFSTFSQMLHAPGFIFEPIVFFAKREPLGSQLVALGCPLPDRQAGSAVHYRVKILLRVPVTLDRVGVFRVEGVAFFRVKLGVLLINCPVLFEIFAMCQVGVQRIQQ